MHCGLRRPCGGGSGDHMVFGDRNRLPGPVDLGPRRPCGQRRPHGSRRLWVAAAPWVAAAYRAGRRACASRGEAAKTSESDARMSWVACVVGRLGLCRSREAAPTPADHGEQRGAGQDAPVELSQISAYILTGDELRQMREEFSVELDHLGRRLFRDLRHKMLPRLAKMMCQNKFFRRYQPDFVKRLANSLELSVVRPGDLIFKVVCVHVCVRPGELPLQDIHPGTVAAGRKIGRSEVRAPIWTRARFPTSDIGEEDRRIEVLS